jgi:P-type E1-E2 ATPase
VRYAEEAKIPIYEPGDFRYEVGRGIVARVQGERIAVGNRAHLLSLGVEVPAQIPAFAGTLVLVTSGDRYCGAISVEDQVRPGAAIAVKALEAMKTRVILLTGDTQSAAEAVADQMGIIHFHSDLLPEQKAVEVAAHTKKGRMVAMLGDGINDAPALIEATVGVAMGSGTDVARESADVVLIGNDLEKFVETVRIARRCRAIIFQNFYGTLIVDTIGIGLAAAGLLNPLLAAFIHVASELTFILNSTRLLPSRRPEAISHRMAAAPVTHHFR